MHNPSNLSLVEAVTPPADAVAANVGAHFFFGVVNAGLERMAKVLPLHMHKNRSSLTLCGYLVKAVDEGGLAAELYLDTKPFYMLDQHLKDDT